MTNIYKYLIGATFCVALTGCIDDKYDLSNIDTTSEFQVKDLVLPVQIDPVALSDIITVKEGDQLKEVTLNGKTFYAVEESGEFESDGIEVNTFKAAAQQLSQKTAQFKLQQPSGVKQNVKRGESNSIHPYFLIEKVQEDIDYEANDVDGTVRELTSLTFKPVTFSIKLYSPNIGDALNPNLEDIVILLPKGLTINNITAPGYTFKAGDYNVSTGRLHLGNLKVQGGQCAIAVIATGVNLDGYDNSYVYNPQTNTGSFSLKSEFSIEDGKLTLNTTSDKIASLGDQIDFTVDFGLTDLEATSVMGAIAYNLEGTGLNLDPITLNDLPKFLEDPETNLILANPQIYLSVNNPVGEFGLGYQSGLDIIAYRGGEQTSYPLGVGNEVKVTGAVGTFNYLLAPEPGKVTDIPEGFASGLNKITYSGLGSILSGNGLPDKLDIKLVDPMIPVQKLKEPFQLGVVLPGMKGKYKFLAPLALEGESRIIYTETKDGWWSEDLQDLVISELTITTTVTNGVPLSAKMAIYPIDKEGNRISGLEIVPVDLPAEAQNMPLTFSIKGEIRDLDGIFITATVLPDGSGEPLSPGQTITLDNIRVKVSGNYTREL